MSTKIYNGYRIFGSSLDEVINKLFVNKENLKKIIEDKIQVDILLEAIHNYNKLCLSEILGDDKSENNPSALGKVISEALKNEEMEKKENIIDIAICLFPQKQTMYGKDYYLMMLFADKENKLLNQSQVWKDLDIEDFYYWDNVDPEDTLTEEEWKIRGEQWYKVLGNNTPAENSLILELKKEYKYKCVYFKDQEALTEMLKDNFQTALLEKDEKKESTIRYYEELLRNKMAEKILISQNVNYGNIQQITKEEKQKLYYEKREISRHNKFTEEEKELIKNNMNKIKKVLNEEIIFENLFEKKDIIQKKHEKLLKTKKIKI